MQNNSTRAPPNQRNFSDGQTPIRPPLNHSGSDRPAARFQGEPAPHLEPLQRSMAMQDEATTGQVMKKLQKDKPDQNSGPAWGNRDGPQEPYSYAPAPISPVPVPPTVEQTSRAAISPSEAVRNELISPNMPNFDAISPSTNERSEDPLHLQANTTKPAYQKAAYKPQVAATSLPRSQSQPDFQRGPPTQPDFAGFTFDLPIVGNNNPQMNQPGIQPDSNPASPNTYSARAPMGGPSNQVRSQSGAEQHPPRSASRQGYQQYGSVSNAERYGSPNIQQTQFRSGSRTQQNPVRTQNQWGGSEISYDYGQEAFSPHRGPQGEPAGKSDQRPSQDSQRFYQDQRQYSAPVHIRQGSLDALQQQRMQIPDSGHPIPARQHEARNNSSSVNPDALPAHPVPVRPGLLQKTSTASAPTIGASRAANGPSATNPNLTPTTSREEKSAPITAYDLNLLVQTIKSNPNDHKTMLTLAKKLVEAASVLANEGGKADAKTTQKNRERYIFDAHKYLKKLVQQGYAEAMFYLAECHGQGSLGLKVDAKEAFNLYTSAAKAGYAQAAYRVAVCCEMGHEEGGGTRRDPLKAMQWYRRAASMGDTPAMYKLGIILLKGLLGQPRNLRDALSWLKRAAERADEENPHALHELGMLYENASPSDSVVKDENYARQLFTQAAELGYKFSQFRLGSAYEYGMLGCPIDPRQSLAWYTRAASQGEHQSELALSGWYLTGADGVNLKQSDTEAYLWAKKAASSGLAKAEYAMGYFTETGIGCTANLDEAKKWYWRASGE